MNGWVVFDRFRFPIGFSLSQTAVTVATRDIDDTEPTESDRQTEQDDRNNSGYRWQNRPIRQTDRQTEQDSTGNSGISMTEPTDPTHSHSRGTLTL